MPALVPYFLPKKEAVIPEVIYPINSQPLFNTHNFHKYIMRRLIRIFPLPKKSYFAYATDLDSRMTLTLI